MYRADLSVAFDRWRPVLLEKWRWGAKGCITVSSWKLQTATAGLGARRVESSEHMKNNGL